MDANEVRKITQSSQTKVEEAYQRTVKKQTKSFIKKANKLIKQSAKQGHYVVSFTNVTCPNADIKKIMEHYMDLGFTISNFYNFYDYNTTICISWEK